MPKYIQVGNDVVEFPDGMSDSQIEQAISETPVFGAMPSKATSPSSGFLMGLKDPITGGAQLLPRALAGVTSLGGMAPNPVSRFFSEEAKRVDEMARAEEQAYQTQRQAQGGSGFDFARLAGNVINPASIVPAARVGQLSRATRLPALGQAAVAGVVGGAMQPVVGDEDFASQKIEQAVIGGVSGPIGEKIVSGAGRVLNPLVSKAEKTMRDLGIVPTTGQTLGGQFKTIEEFAQNLPIVGSSIENARQRVLFNFNKGVINKALKKIDDELPADVIGRDAISYASNQVSKQYDDVLSKMSFDLHFSTYRNISDSIAKAKNISPSQRQEISTTINDTVFSKFAGQKLDGQTYKGIESDLRKKASNYSTSSLASEREIGDALSDVLGVIKKELYAQNQKQTSQLRRIDNAYGDLSVINLAAANSGAASGVFTPRQFSTAVRQQDQTRRKSLFAKGRARSQEISDAAVEILEETGKSTLEGRIAASAMGGFGLISQPQVAIPGLFAVPAAYSSSGQNIIDAILRSRPDLSKQIGGLLSQQSTPLGGVVAPSAVLQYNLSERR
jgi:hypothetical protein